MLSVRHQSDMIQITYIYGKAKTGEEETFLHSFCYDKVGKREKVGTLMGKDPFGNSYYELPAQPQVEIQSNMRSLRLKKLKLCAVGKKDAHSVV